MTYCCMPYLLKHFADKLDSGQREEVTSQANTSIRWLLLQPTTKDPKLESVCRSSARMREEVFLGLL